jgi:hypothetical protein
MAWLKFSSLSRIFQPIPWRHDSAPLQGSEQIRAAHEDEAEFQGAAEIRAWCTSRNIQATFGGDILSPHHKAQILVSQAFALSLIS